jgi:DNA repair protein RecO (recombination protein O)
MEKDTGTILRQQPLGEHGLIITWCTAGHGIVRSAARLARKPGSELSGQVDLFHECELLYKPASQGDLHTLCSVSLISPRLALRSKLLKLRLASYMARLLLATVEPGAADADWHKLISGALDYVTANEPRRAILLHFEKRLAELHGLFTPAMAPHNTLLRHFQNLPSGRTDLLEALPS